MSIVKKIKVLIKSTEAIVVLAGLLLTVIFGKLFAIITAVAYILLNVTNFFVKEKKVEVPVKKKEVAPPVIQKPKPRRKAVRVPATKTATKTKSSPKGGVSKGAKRGSKRNLKK